MTAPVDRESCLAVGMDHYLTQPPHKAELLEQSLRSDSPTGLLRTADATAKVVPA